MKPWLSAAEGAQQSSRSPLVRMSRLVSVGIREAYCVLQTLALIGTGRLAMPKHHVGRRITFADRSSSTVYRETVRKNSGAISPIILVVRFRLRLIGRSPLWHAAFRFESLFNTLLFAAHEGFVTKLWLTDYETGYYRGIYEWNGEQAAQRYVRVLGTVLHPWVQAGSFGYETFRGVNRSDYLAGRVAGSEVIEPGLLWCVPISPEQAGAS